MTGARQILFIQGGGAGAHDEWDDKLCDSLRRELGDGYEVRYPRMPDEDDPGYARWSAAIHEEMTSLDDGAVVVGHSVGATILINLLAERPPEPTLSAIMLVAAPFVGPDGWPGDEFELPDDLGTRLPPGVTVHVFHGLDDETAPASHADLYAHVIPQARIHLLPERDHQLNNDLSEVARAIKPDNSTLGHMAIRTSGTRQQSIWASIVSDDAPALRDWLLALGFTEDLIIPGEHEDAIHHCQMDWPEGGRIMLSSTGERQTRCLPGTSSLHVVTADPDAVMVRARAVDATIVHQLTDQTDYPSREFTVADPDGNHWTFATFAG